MGKKCLEEFNPWPPFVDIFSSTILVLLLFMLILIVNLGYYAQFKFKVSYTGTVATDKLISDDASINKVKELKETTENIVKSSISSKVEEAKDLEQAGQDLVQEDRNQKTLQKTIEDDQFMVLNFANKEIILDNNTIKKVKDFIKKAKNKFPKHKIIVSSVEPLNQVSATISKQISLARTLNTRNLIRKQNYAKSDVRIRLMDEKVKSKLPDNESGYVYIFVKVNN